MLQKFLQDRNLFVDIYILFFVKLILQEKTVGIPGCHVDKRIIKLQRVNIIIQLQFELTERVYDLPSGRIPLICHLHQVTAVLISFIDFIEITDPAEKMDTLDAGPVNRICNVCCICKFSLRDQSVDLIQAYF